MNNMNIQNIIIYIIMGMYSYPGMSNHQRWRKCCVWGTPILVRGPTKILPFPISMFVFSYLLIFLRSPLINPPPIPWQKQNEKGEEDSSLQAKTCNTTS